MIKKFILLVLAVLISLVPAQASVTFDGISAYMQTAQGGSSANIGGLRSLTMSAWIWMPASGLPVGYANPAGDGYFYGRVIDDIDNSPNQNFNFLVTDCGYNGGTPGKMCIAFNMDNPGLNSYISITLTNSTVPLYGAKHHIVIAWNNATGVASTDFVFYIDGVQQSTSNISDVYTANPYSSSWAIENSQQQILLGAANGEGVPKTFFIGAIADIAVWNIQLSSAQVATLYNEGYPSTCKRTPLKVSPSNLIIYFPLDDKETGTVSTDPVNLGTGGSTFVINLIGGTPVWTPTFNCESISGGILDGSNIN